MEKQFEYYLEMARAAVPLKRKNADNFKEAMDYLEESIDKEIDKRDNDTLEDFDMNIKSFITRYGFTEEDTDRILKELNSRYTDWSFRVNPINRFNLFIFKK